MPANATAAQSDPLPPPFSLTWLAPGRWAAHLTADGDTTTVATSAVHAVATETGDDQPVTITTHHVSAVVAGAIEITVGHIDRTDRHTTAEATVHQHGRVVARLLITTVTKPRKAHEGS